MRRLLAFITSCNIKLCLNIIQLPNLGINVDGKAELISTISRQLILLRDGIYNRKQANDQSWSIYAETLIAEIMNVRFGYKLRNRNVGNRQSIGFDLEDPIERVVVQVTSRIDARKIQKTAKHFEDDAWEGYKAFIFILDDNCPERPDLRKYPRFHEQGQILSIATLNGDIPSLEISKIIQIMDILKVYLGAPRQPRMLSTSILERSHYAQKVTFANYANRYSTTLRKCCVPRYHDMLNAEITLGELDLELHFTDSEFWATRIQEFPIAFISRLNEEELESTKTFLSMLFEAEIYKSAFFESFRSNAERDIALWAALDTACAALVAHKSKLISVLGIANDQINDPEK